MKLEISKEQCMRLAEQEGDEEVGAGALGLDPAYRPSRWKNFRSIWAWRVRMLSYWMDERRIPGGWIVFRVGIRWIQP